MNGNLQVRHGNGQTTPFSPDLFAGTLVRTGVAPSTALEATASVHGVLQGAAVEAVSTDALRAATGEIVVRRDQVDIGTIRRILVPQTAGSMLLSISFSQRQIYLDGAPSERSDWGAISVRYQSAARLSYLNVALPGRWIIRNAPLFPAADESVVKTLLYFDLGTRPGFSVTSMHAAVAMTADILAEPPSRYAVVPVQAATEMYWTNFIDEPFAPLGAPPSDYEGGRISGVFFCRTNYPNQHCKQNECAPAAVSNGLQWLSQTYGLKIDPTKLTIDYWNAALGNTGAGVVHGAWAMKKKSWTDDAHNGIPVDTYPQDGSKVADVLGQFHGTSAPPASDVDAKLGKKPTKQPQALEMDAGGHVASVVCIGGPDETTGNYHLMCASDTKQGDPPGNPEVQQVELTSSGEFVNAVPPCWKKGDKVQNFVVQCPHPNKF